MKEIKDSHIALTAIPEIQEIGKPLAEFLGVSSFCYHKWNSNGQEICLSNNATWARHVYENNYTGGEDLASITDLDLLGIKNLKSLLWVFEKETKMMHDCRKIWDCHYGISLISGNNECFAFSIQGIKDTRAINTYLNNIELLEKFCRYFKDKAGHIITKALQDTKLQHPNAVKTNPNNQFLYSKNKFIANASVPSFPLTHHSKNIKFTNRELDCLRLFVRGYTTPEVAYTLGLSKRTAETHLENIKNKTGINAKSDLIKFVFSNNLDKYL